MEASVGASSSLREALLKIANGGRSAGVPQEQAHAREQGGETARSLDPSTGVVSGSLEPAEAMQSALFGGFGSLGNSRAGWSAFSEEHAGRAKSPSSSFAVRLSWNHLENDPEHVKQADETTVSSV